MQGIKLIDLPKEHKQYTSQLNQAISNVLNEGKYINGPEVRTFTEKIASYLNTPFVIPCANGTDALQVALMALDLKLGDEILLPSFNYVAAIETVVLLGLKPVFVDVNPSTFNISMADLKQKITSKSKAIIVVHLFGLVAEMDEIMALASHHQLKVIEDNAQSFGSDYNGKKAGTIGDIGTTSFFPTKNLGCLGDGGAIFCNDKMLGEKIKAIASHGQKERYTFDYIGVNSRLDTLQAAILTVKLDFLETRLQARRSIAKKYIEELQNFSDLVLPSSSQNNNHSYNQFTIQIPNRDIIKDKLEKAGIPTMIYYPKALHQQPAYSSFFTSPLPVSEQLCKTVLSLPVHPVLSEKEQDYIIKILKEVL